ncbi:MAG: hypothetical protein RLZZ292_2732 [Bacteroidota bacterium]|jgi:hypothetical protein
MTAIEEYLSDALIRLYPNPTSSRFFIELPSNSEGQLTLLDAQGKKILEMPLSEYNELNVSDLVKGMYLAKITIDNKVVYKKVFVL